MFSKFINKSLLFNYKNLNKFVLFKSTTSSLSSSSSSSLNCLNLCKTINPIRIKKTCDINGTFLIKRYQSNSPKKIKQNLMVSWRHVIVTFIFGGATILFMLKLKHEKEESIKKQRKQAIGKMAIGGPFELIDHEGKLSKSSEFLGQWLLIYFGFTHCPDICPEEMEKMCKSVDLIDKVKIKGDPQLTPIFITVDPERDNVKAVSKYIKDFSTKLIGFTGSKEQIEQVTKAYRVYFSKGPRDEDNDYIVDHTVIMYLVDPEGNFVDYFGQNKSAEEIATAIAIHMGSYQASESKQK